MQKSIKIILIATLVLSGCAARTNLKTTFNKPLKITPLYDNYWMLQDDLVMHITRQDPPLMDVEIKVPAGFITDLASIPFPANLIFSKAGRYASAGIVHDYLYWVQPCKNKLVADRLIKEALKASDHIERDGAEGLSATKEKLRFIRRYLARNTIKYGVMVGGFYAWNSNYGARSSDPRYVKPEFRDKIIPGERWDSKKETYGMQIPELIPILAAESNGQAIKEPDYCGVFANEW